MPKYGVTKTRLSISLDTDLAEILKHVADERRTTVSALITEYALALAKNQKTIPGQVTFYDREPKNGGKK